MKEIELISEQDNNIKRFYLDQTLTVKAECPNCGRMLTATEGMIEYPQEGLDVWFICGNEDEGIEGCNWDFKKELKCTGSKMSFTFEVPSDVEVELDD